MKEKYCEIRLIDKNKNILTSIKSITYCDKNTEEIYYIDPETGKEFYNIDKCNKNWVIAPINKQMIWRSLVRFIKLDDEIISKTKNNDIIEYKLI